MFEELGSISTHMELMYHTYTYTKVKKKCPIFMVLYLSIQLSAAEKLSQNDYQTSNKQKMVII